MQWSPQQDAALTAVSRWLKADDRQVFRLFGYAGAGKTTLARHIAAHAGGEVAFGAFTGKAALVLRTKGCEGASTIHSMIYRSPDAESETPSFVLNHDGPASKAELIIIDECSMVDEELARDLLSFDKPVLVLGDPAQLPPVKGGGFFTDAEPDIMLEEVHRQAAGNPIIAMSMQVREGGRLELGSYGESRVIDRRSIDAGAVLSAGQVLVGINKTRRAYNQRMRQLKGFASPEPMPGEKLVCLRNDRTKGLLNGGIWTVESVKAKRKGFLRMTLTPEDDVGRKTAKVAVLPHFFLGTESELPYSQRRESDEFDFGYALTVHKAQGSQWDEVVLFDESYAFREHRARWLYTGLTRAAKKITVVM